jgi:hypothetical protein
VATHTIETKPSPAATQAITTKVETTKQQADTLPDSGIMCKQAQSVQGSVREVAATHEDPVTQPTATVMCAFALKKQKASNTRTVTPNHAKEF